MAKIIPNGSSLFIDIGTTPEAVAKALLDHQNLRIKAIVNLNAAYILMQNKTFDITMASGSCVKMEVLLVKRQLHLSDNSVWISGILGISSIDLDGSLLDYDYHECETCNYGKLKKYYFSNRSSQIYSPSNGAYLGSLTEVDYLFTDTTPPDLAA